MPNLRTTLSHIWHALISGGRFVCAVWAEASKVPLLSFRMNIVMHGTPGPFALADTSILQGALSNAGFTSISIL